MPEVVVVPVDLANRILAILGQLPYARVADEVNELRAIEITNGNKAED